MQVKALSDVFVASGIEMVDDVTFTALFYGYEVRGKVRVPTTPMVEFFFYGSVYIDSKEMVDEFVNDFDEKFGHARMKFSDKYVSILLDIGGMEAPQVKERLGAIGNFMIQNGFGATAMPPEEPEPEPEPEKKPEPAPRQQQQQQAQQQQQPAQRGGIRQRQRQQPNQDPPLQHMQQRPQRQAPQQPVYEEPKVPFEQYKVVQKLTQVFINGVNQTSNNMFTTLYHGYNVVGKMLSPAKDDIEVVFYGQLMNNVTEEFEELKATMNEKYGNVPMRMIGGSCDAILYLEGRDVAQSKEMLGCISGFMMKNNIAAMNLPNTVGNTIKTYTAENFKPSVQTGPRSLGGFNPQAGTPPTPTGRSYQQNTGAQSEGGNSDGNNFAKNFLNRFKK